jgi:hypothetical protein
MTILISIAFYLTIILLPIGLISLWSAGQVSGKYYDDQLKKLNQELPFVIIFGFSDRSARAGCYLLLILTNNNPFIRNNYLWYPLSFIRHYQLTFGDVDYRGLARKRDWVMAIILWGSMLGFLSSAIITCVASALSSTS